ncbi:MAG TPA: limonene-1,2-epoxide hydrolase family protein [Myxococcota bacterium]|nr:limonene-1,2-epoxide hydrolase family protein [Myxococcota bacterium]
MSALLVPVRNRSFLRCVPLLAWLLLPGVLAPRDAEAGPSAAEQAAIEVVDRFIAAWDDPDAAVALLAPEASVRMVEDQPPIVGRAAIGDAMKGFMKPGVSLTVETVATTVYGPIVVNRRIDTMKTEGEAEQVFPVVGVFLVKDGLIAEWTDYLDR